MSCPRQPPDPRLAHDQPPRRRLAAGWPAVVMLTFLGLTGCGSPGSGASSSGGSTTARTGANPTASVSSTPAETSSPAPSSASSTTLPASAGGLPKDHSVCVLIDAATATTLLGGKPTTMQIPDTSTAEIVHVDRCNWNAASASLAYQVNRYANPALAGVIVKAITAHLPPTATSLDFPPSGKGFVVSLGPKAMARAIIPLASGVVLDLTTTAATPDKAESLMAQVASTLTKDAGG